MSEEIIHKTTEIEYFDAINKYIEMIDCEDAYKINDYVCNLEYDKKKYKEVIDKATYLLENQSQDMMGNYFFDDNIAEKLLIILKEGG